MKPILFLLTLTTFVVAQEYQKAKIDMHGGQVNKYDSMGGYYSAGIRDEGISLSGFLDKNTTKNIQKKNK